MAFSRVALTLTAAAVPAYIADLAPYATRQLSGPYAPPNGFATMLSILPSEWTTSNPAGVIAAWNGGGKSLGPKSTIHGGGHNDTDINGNWVYDFLGTTRPNGFSTPLNISAKSAVRAGSGSVFTYTDGRPVPVHTYDGTVYAHHNDTLYRFGGARYSDGNFTDSAFKLPLATGVWAQLPNYPTAQGTAGCQTIYDPVTRKILVFNGSSFFAFFFRCDNDTFSASKAVSHVVDFGAVGAWDSSRSRGLMVGQGTLTQFAIDFAAETVTTTRPSASGSTAIVSAYGPSIVYDALLDCYWLWGGAGSSNWSTLYRMNASTYAITANAITPSLPVESQQGSYGRFAFMSSFRALGVFTAHNAAPHIIRLPST